MKANILSIGDEILIGQVVNTNVARISAMLSEIGIEVLEHLSVSDTGSGIINGVERALEAADLVIMTGGLGPTRDDITKKVLVEYLGGELVFHEKSWKALSARYRSYGKELKERHRQQCMMPDNATILPNELGTAPGMWFDKEEKILVSLPGVPYEMEHIMIEEVLPRLVAMERSDQKIRTLTLLTAGMGEGDLAIKMEPIEEKLPEHMSLAYLPHLGTVRLRLTHRGDNEKKALKELDTWRKRIVKIAGDIVFGFGKGNLASEVGERLSRHQKTLAVAESCTGGYLGHYITSIPGSSAYFVGGVIAYENRIKESLLGVSPQTIKNYGAVSEQTVLTMATGVRNLLNTDYAIATSGIAGPGGGSKNKPVGMIWIAVAGPEHVITRKIQSGGDRIRNIQYGALSALDTLRRELDKLDAKAVSPSVKTPEEATQKTRSRKM